LKKGLEELTQVSNEVFTKMYQNANPNGANTGDAGNAGSSDKKDDGDPEVVID